MRRPKYLQYLDAVQDVIEEAPGITIAEIMKRTGLSYVSVQRATSSLRVNRRIQAKKHKRILKFSPYSGDR